jgi:hypothetical protein
MKAPPLIMNLGFAFMDMFSKISDECMFCWNWGSLMVLLLKTSTKWCWHFVDSGWLIKIEIKEKFASIGIDDGSLFVGCRTSVYVQLKEKVALFLVVVHYCAHHTNLAIQVLFIMHLEDVLQLGTHILPKVPKKCLSYRSFSLSLTPKVIKFCRTSKLARFPYCLLASRLCWSIRPSLWKCGKIRLKMEVV